MFQLKIENSRGEIYELTHNPNYSVIHMDGLTYPSTTINTSTGGTIDGSFYNSSRVENRNLVITLVLHGDIEANRQQLYRIFPIKRPVTVYFKNANRDIKIEGHIETLEGDLFSQQEQMQISVICPQPYFEDINTIVDEMSKIMSGFEFPFSIAYGSPIPISELVEYPLVTINNAGDAQTGFLMHISFTGIITGLKISNTTTQKFMEFVYVFHAGDELNIDTRQGHMRCILQREGDTYNILNWLSDDSTWLKLDYGDNEFTYTVDAHEEYVTIQFEVIPLYGGV